MTTENRLAVPHGQQIDIRLADWAASHYGLVTRRKLRALGVTDEEIRGGTDRGSLLRAGAGVYYVGHRSGVPGQREAVAIAAAGPRALLSGASMAAWRGMITDWRGPVHLIVPAGRRLSPPGVVRHVAELLEADRGSWRGLPCVTPERAVMDLPREHLRQALQWLMREGRPVEPILDRMHGRRGVAAFREEVAQLIPQLAHTMSELEARFVRLLARHGIVVPVINGTLAGGDLLDCAWPGSRLVVELDGRRWHVHRDREDRARDRRRVLEGRFTLRYDWWDVTRHKTRVAREVAQVLSR